MKLASLILLMSAIVPPTASTTAPITNTVPLDCAFLDANCCNAEAIAYLNSVASLWSIFPLFKDFYQNLLKEKSLCEVSIEKITTSTETTSSTASEFSTTTKRMTSEPVKVTIAVPGSSKTIQDTISTSTSIPTTTTSVVTETPPEHTTTLIETSETLSSTVSSTVPKSNESTMSSTRLLTTNLLSMTASESGESTFSTSQETSATISRFSTSSGSTATSFKTSTSSRTTDTSSVLSTSLETNSTNSDFSTSPGTTVDNDASSRSSGSTSKNASLSTSSVTSTIYTSVVSTSTPLVNTSSVISTSLETNSTNADFSTSPGTTVDNDASSRLSGSTSKNASSSTSPVTSAIYTSVVSTSTPLVNQNTITISSASTVSTATERTNFSTNSSKPTSSATMNVSSTSPLTSPEPTTTYNWPTGGTTRHLPSGEIIISESLIAYKNCTTVLMQLIYNPRTNETRTEKTSNPEGCKTTSSVSNQTTTHTPTVKTTTYNWPTGGTTRVLPSGEIILSESLIAYKNCTTVLMQLIYNPSTNETRTETTSDAQGCKATSTSKTSSKYSTTPMTSTTQETTNKSGTTVAATVKTTTYNWPTGGTTRVLPSGEIILSESLIAYKNCTTVLMQLIYNPSTNETRTETTSDAQGCKATSTSKASSKYSTTPMTTSAQETTNKSGTTVAATVKTTTYNWPTGGTTRVLPSGEIILSESLIAYKNCTTVLMQLIYNPSTNETRTETTSDAQGCKATSSTSATITTTQPTTTNNWPTGGTTRVLPSGEIILSESLIAYKNCTTVLMQLIYNPRTNKTRTETTSDAQGCKATSSTSSTVTTATPASSTSTTSHGMASTTYNWPTGGTTRILPSGEIILSESLIAYKNCTTVLMQLIYNPSTNQTRTETNSNAEGCKSTTISEPKQSTTSSTSSCLQLSLNLTSATRPTSSEMKAAYSVGEQVVHICQKYFSFEVALQPLKIYKCMDGGNWSGTPEVCVDKRQKTEL